MSRGQSDLASIRTSYYQGYSMLRMIPLIGRTFVYQFDILEGLQEAYDGV